MHKKPGFSLAKGSDLENISAAMTLCSALLLPTLASLPMAPPPIFKLGPFEVSNSMIVAWTVAALIILFAQIATRNLSLVPNRKQGIWEMIIEAVSGILEGILGHDLMRKTFWFFATVFIFIAGCNYFALFPGVGTIGWGEGTAWWNLEHIDRPLIRGVNADANMTLGMALVFFFLWLVWSFRALGVGGVVHHIFGSKAKLGGLLGIVVGGIFIFVGLIEVISILFRPVSLTFRLYGNIYGGESMLESIYHLNPNLAFLTLIPFYFFEVLVATVQAMVFCLLTAAFTGMMCRHDDAEHGHENAHEAGPA